jgi:hypothetical protein
MIGNEKFDLENIKLKDYLFRAFIQRAPYLQSQTITSLKIFNMTASKNSCNKQWLLVDIAMGVREKITCIKITFT